MADLNGYTLDFAEIRLSDLGRVGGKNASLGEMLGSVARHRRTILNLRNGW